MSRFLPLGIVVLALGATACRHSAPATSPWIVGRPPEYRLPSQTPARESVSSFVARVRRLQAQALASRSRTILPTVETTDARLGRSLALLAVQPSADSHRTVAAEYLRVGVRDMAMEHFSEAVRMDRMDAESFDMRARIWRDWGFPQNGLPDAHRAAYYAPRSPVPHNTLGTLFHRMGRYANARVEYERALALDPNAPYALSNLCALDLDERRTASALTSCRRALDVAPESAALRARLERATATQVAADAENDDGRH